MNRQRLMIVVGAVVALALLTVGVVVLVTGHLPFHHDAERTELQTAVALAPEDSQRLSWTDWAGVRDELGTSKIEPLLDRGFDADLTSTSALVQSAPVLDQDFGFSPATLEWELFAQSEDGAVVIMQLPDGAADDVVDDLRELGFSEPSKPDGVWGGGPDLLVGIGDLTPELGYFSVDAERGLLLSSDTTKGLEQGIASAQVDEDDDAAGGPDVGQVVTAMGSPVSAAIYTGPQACNALAMAGADDADRAEGDQAIASAGDINPVTGFAIGAEPGGGVRVALSFENEKQARENADSRARLASGPAPGQGGDFTDRFTLGEVKAEGAVVTMALKPVKGAYVVSDLSSGPVLFATC